MAKTTVKDSIQIQEKVVWLDMNLGENRSIKMEYSHILHERRNSEDKTNNNGDTKYLSITEQAAG